MADGKITKTSGYRATLKALKQEIDSQGWTAHWRDLSKHILPRRSRYLYGNDTSQHNDGHKKHQDIINSTGKNSVNIAASGLHGGLTSPARPWFTLGLADPELAEFTPVREWLDVVRNGMLTVFSRSNFYNSIHSVYRELVTYGVNAMLIEQDFETVIRCKPFTIGEFMIAVDPNGRPDTLYRQVGMSSRQLVMKFGIDKVSEKVKTAYSGNGTSGKIFEVVHVIEPRKDVNIFDIGLQGTRYKDVYFEVDADQNDLLQDGGYIGQPFIAPRWDVVGLDAYGDCPAIDELGDIKQLLALEDDKLELLGKHVRPPMNAPTSMAAKGGTIIEGGVNYVDQQTGGQSFTPAYVTNPVAIQQAQLEIREVEKRIKEGFYVDLFKAIIDSPGHQQTATEIARKYEEKLVNLGPILERLQAEMLDKIIDRSFDIMNDLGMLPPMPEEMRGIEKRIEYVSLLAQAQKMVGTTSIDQTLDLVGRMAAIDPNVVDKIDGDQVIDEYSNMLGVPTNIIRSDDAVAKIREARAVQQQQDNRMAQAAVAVDSAKTMSDTGLGNNSALDALMGNAGVTNEES